ncbi:MAG TPA: PilN domain-containing protein [Burkholderiales bacterium]|nr:PilN domain-containing protein [Burkholderiales bacterium]
MKTALLPLQLDFRAATRAPLWASALLAAIALAFAFELGLSYQKTREATAEAEHRLARSGKRNAPSRDAAALRASAEEMVAAREAYDRLAIPWESLFRALESTATEKVSLTAIEPDAKAGSVLISGEANDFLAALDYVGRLERSGTLKGAHLVKHELRPGDAQRPIAFSISASWKGES